MDKETISCLTVLGFTSFATPSEDDIKKKWKNLCKKAHPDVGGDEEHFHKIMHAYNYLTDASYRATRRPERQSDLDLRVQFPITFEEAMFGTKIVLNYSVNEVASLKNKEKLETESVTVGIEAGSFNIQPAIIPMKGFRRGEIRGNLILSIMVEAHPKFRAAPSQVYGGYGNKYDIISQEQVDLIDLLKGAKREFLTMHGFQNVRIRPGTGPGSQIRVQGKGCNGGDHVIVVAPSFPAETDLRSSKWKGLEIDWSE